MPDHNNTVRVLFFAQLREDLNCDGITLPLSKPCSVSDIKASLINENPQWQNTFKHHVLLASVNQTLAELQDSVSAGDEVAFFPPVTGG